jgi:hypothetical protein
MTVATGMIRIHRTPALGEIRIMAVCVLSRTSIYSSGYTVSSQAGVRVGFKRWETCYAFGDLLAAIRLDAAI